MRRLLAALPLGCAVLLLARGEVPFYWPIALAVVTTASVVVPLRASLTTFGALLWMIGGAAVPVLWIRNTTADLPPGLSAALVLACIAGVRLFLEPPLFGRGVDRALVIFACVGEGFGAHSTAYPYAAAVLVASVLLDLGGGFAALRSWARMPRTATGLVMLGGSFAVSMALLLPVLDRATNRRFQSLFEVRSTQTRFTPHVRLDQPGFIRTDDDIVLRLHGAPADYLRGAVFDSFDGTYWSLSSHAAPPPPGPATSARTEVDAVEATPWLFAPRAARIVGDTEWEADPLGALHPVTRGVKRWAFAPTAGANDTPTDLDRAVPAALAPKLEALALQWTAWAEGDRARVLALLRHLREDFAYSLARPATPRGQSALLDFLFVHREGHCEFFASAFVALVRVLGIPARLVAGYRVVERNGFGGYAIVRAKHAHAWAEVYLPSPGPSRAAFEVFDPTPAAPNLAEADDRSVFALFDYVWTSLTALYDRAANSPERTLPALAGIVVIAFAVRAWRNGRLRVRKAEDDTDAPPAAFAQFEARLAKEGFVRDPSETLESLAARLEAEGHAAWAQALHRYATARYGGMGASERDFMRALQGDGGD